jgi:hypothetical protein
LSSILTGARISSSLNSSLLEESSDTESLIIVCSGVSVSLIDFENRLQALWFSSTSFADFYL